MKRRVNWAFIDADDTVLGIEINGQTYGTAYAYTHALNKYAALMQNNGFSPETARKRQNEIDTILAKQYGFGDKTRFGRSMVMAYEELELDRGAEPSNLFTTALMDIGMGVFTHPYVALPGALNFLAQVHKYYNIAIVTKGEAEEQRKKVFDSMVFVYADQILPLEFKSIDEWRTEVFDALAISAPVRLNSWAIGNSVKSDVNPPMALGTNGIHLAVDSWSFENASPIKPLSGCQFHVVQTLEDALPLVLPSITA